MNVTQGRIGAVALVGALLLVSATGVNAQETTYRWVDANGEVHYTDHPPPADARESRVLKGSGKGAGTPADTDTDSDSYTEQEADFQRRRATKAEEDAKAAQAGAAEAERAQNCNLARGNLQTVSAGGRITRKNAQGETVFLTDEQIAQEQEKARESVKQWCSE